MPQIQYLGPLEAKTPNIQFLGPLDGTAEEELMRVEQIPGGYGSTEPWVDPTTVFGIGAMQGVRAGVKAGVGVGRAAIRGLTSGLTGAVAEYPIGTSAEIVEKETSPMVALPFNIAVGLLSAATVERVIENRVARALGSKATPKVVAETATAIKAKVATKDYTDPIVSKPIEKEEIVDLTEEVLPVQKQGVVAPQPRVEPVIPHKPVIERIGDLEPAVPMKEAATLEAIPSEGLVNSITRKEAGDMMVNGDKDVAHHIAEGVLEKGRPQVEDAIRNEELGRIAKTPKGAQREALKQGLARLEPAINDALEHPEEIAQQARKAKGQSDTEISLTDFVRKYGGLSTKKEALKGEIRDRLTIKEGFNLVNNKTGRTLDEMTEGSIAGGYLPEGATVRDFLDAIDADVTAKKAKTQTGRAWSSFKQDFEVPEQPAPKVAPVFGDIEAIALKKGKVVQEGLFGGPEIVGVRPAKPISTREQPGLFAGEAKATPALPEAPKIEMEAPKEQLPFEKKTVTTGTSFENIKSLSRTHWTDKVLPELRDYFAAYNDLGSDRLEKNIVKPEGMNATDWLINIMGQQPLWDKGQKKGLTGIQMLSQKGLWPDGEGKGERLRKAMLASVKAIKSSPSYSQDWIRAVEAGDKDIFGVTSGALPSISKEAGHLVLPEGLSRIGKSTKEFFVPLSTLPEGEKYKALRYKSFGDVDRAERFAGKIWDRTKNLTPEVKRDMFRFLDGEVSKESLPANVRPLAQSLQTINNMIGKMLVNKGLLDEATYEAHKGQYIKYLYLKHLLPEDAKLPIGHSGKLDLSYLKGRMDPVVKVSRSGKEYVDKNVYEGLLKVAEDLGVTHERRFKAKRGALGYATKGTGETVTQYGTELSVLAHELGHQLDFKYNLWDRIVGEGVSSKGKDVVNKELRSLADLTFEGSEVSKYYKTKVRETAEKMAHMLEAYIHAPTRFKEVAPETYSRFDSFIKSQPETAPLSKILQGLALKEVEVKHYQVTSRGGHAYTSPTLTLKEAKAKLPSIQKQVDNYRKEIGLVEDVSVAEPVGVLKPLTDLSKHKFYSEIAVNPEWTWQPSVVTVDGKKMGIGALAEEVKVARQMFDQAPHVPEIKARFDRLDTALQSAITETKNVTEDYVQLPTSKSYGPLAGAYIRKEIARDIQPVFSGFNNQGDLSKAVNTIFQIERKGMAMFKVGKTAFNVPTIVRNMGSNVIQLNMSGIPLHNVPGLLVKSASAMKNKDKFYVEGLRNGIFKTNWSEAEIGEVLDTVRTMQKTSVMQMYGQIGKLAKFYGKIDDFFKLAKFIEQREKGIDISKAAIEAHKWGMDYSLAHPAIKIARQHIMPFVSYQYKIAPLIAETLAKRPWVIAKYAAIPYLMYEAAKQTLSLSDDDFEKLRKDLPLYIQKTGSYAVLPWKSPEGNVQWVNLEYFIPWGNAMSIARDVKEGQARDLIGDVGIGNPFLDVYSAIKTSKGDTPAKDPFSGREIWNALDTPTEKSLKMAEWLYGKWAPSMLTREGAGGYTLRVGEKDRYGRSISPEQAAGRWVGLNIIAPTTQQGAIEKRAREKELLSSLYRILKDPTITEEKKQRARDEFLKKAREIRGIKGAQTKPDISTLSDEELKAIIRRPK